MESLPIEILEDILSHLDDDSLWRAMHTCRDWLDVIGHSKRLMNKFVLDIGPKFFSQLKLDLDQLKSIKSIRLAGICLSSGDDQSRDETEKLMNFIGAHSNSIECLILSDVEVLNFDTFEAMLLKLTNLKCVKVIKVHVAPPATIKSVEMPRLESISLKCFQGVEDIFEVFTASTNISKLQLEFNPFYYRSPALLKLINLMKALPNMSHLTIKQPSGVIKPTVAVNPAQLVLVLVKILVSQKAKLKELTADVTLFNAAIVKITFEHLNLERATVAGTKIIESGRKVNVESTNMHRGNTQLTFEMLRRFPTITKLIYKPLPTGKMTVPENAFDNIRELEIVNTIGSFSRSDFTISSFLKRFKSVKKLTYKIVEIPLEYTYYRGLRRQGNRGWQGNESINFQHKRLQCFLSVFTDLEELVIDFVDQLTLLVIEKKCCELKRLLVNPSFVEACSEYFGDKMTVAGNREVDWHKNQEELSETESEMPLELNFKCDAFEEFLAKLHLNDPTHLYEKFLNYDFRHLRF